MSTNDNTISAALQILFGVTGIFSVVVGLLGLHHRDSLVFVLYRRLRGLRPRCTYPLEEGLASNDNSMDEQRVPERTWTEQSQPLSDSCLAARPLSESDASNASRTCLSTCSTAIATGPVESAATVAG